MDNRSAPRFHSHLAVILTLLVLCACSHVPIPTQALGASATHPPLATIVLPTAAPTNTPLPPTPTLAPTPVPTRIPSACQAIKPALAFLATRFNPDLGLLNESPVAFPNRYWLANDNVLAAYALEQFGQEELGGKIRASLATYGFSGNGQIETAWGTPVVFPPLTGTTEAVAVIGEDTVQVESHTFGVPMPDWAEYANLAFLGALNLLAEGKTVEAARLYGDTLMMFDGTGFKDKAYTDKYGTYKLAMALYGGLVLGAPNAYHEQMMAVMLDMQATEGGFYTDYFDQNRHDGDANTETTSWALLALKAYGCPPD